MMSFKGKQYDPEKVEVYFNKVEEKIAKIEERNAKKLAIGGHVKALEGYCTFCGAVRPSGEIGIGGGCEHICEKFKDGYIALFYPEKPEEWQADLFVAYRKYAKYARALFLHYNKNARNNFIKSFYASMESNKECKISRKQLEVIEKNAQYKDFYDTLINYRKYVYNKFGYANKNLYYKSLDFDRDFALYCRIQYAKAWM